MKKTSDIFNIFGIDTKKKKRVVEDDEPIKKKKKKKVVEDDAPVKKKKKRVDDDEPVKKKKKKKKKVIEIDDSAERPKKKSKEVEAPFVVTESRTKTKSSKKEQKYGKLMTDLFPDFSTEEDYELAADYRKRLNKHTPDTGLGSISDMYDIDPVSGLAVPKDKQLILPEDFDVREMMRDATDPVTGTVRDLKIDDRDLPLAKNYYDFSFRIIGKDAHPPWSRQMWTGLMLFGEVCPCCSNPKFMDIHNVPKRMPAKDLAGDLVILEHGVCPKCKRTKWDLYKNHGLRLYQQLANLLGQRCVTHDSLVLTDNGMEYIDELAPTNLPGFSRLEAKVHNGREIETTSDFYISPTAERLTTVVLRNGLTITGTKDHPLKTSQGFVRLENINKSHYVEVVRDTQVFGSKLASFNDAYAFATQGVSYGTCTRIKSDRGLLNTDFATLLGLWVAEGSGPTISNTDPDVNSFVDKVLAQHINRHDYSVNNFGARILGSRGRKYLQFFVGDGANSTQKDLTSKSAKKSIPKCIRSAPKDIVCAFLRGLFEGDGSVGIKHAANKYPCLSYATISKKLGHELMATLLNLGMRPRLRIRHTWATNGTNKQVSKKAYCIVLKGQDLTIFRDQIGFLTPTKTNRLDRAIDRFTNKKKKSTFFEDVLPPYMKDEVFAYLSEVRKSLAQVKMPKEWTAVSKVDVNATLMSKSYTKRRLNACIGFNTLLNYPIPNTPASRNMLKRMKEADNVPLTKRKLQIIVKRIDYFAEFLPAHVMARLEYFKTFLNPNVMYIKISEISHTRKEITYDLTLPSTHRFIANGIVNHNSGKSSSAAGYAAYGTHRYLKFPNLAHLSTSMQASTELTATFVSLSLSKAIGVLWTPFRKMLEDSTWFKAYFKLLDHYKVKYGKELYRDSTLYLKVFHKNLHFYPSGPRSSTLRGDTRIMALLDELGLFPLPKGDQEEDETSERANADEAHKSLTNSLTTVQAVSLRLLEEGQSSVPPALMICVSSPASQRDKMMRLIRESRTEVGSRHILGVQLPTWEANPSIERDHPIIEMAYNANPEKAERDFGANPPMVHSTYIKRNLVEHGIFVNGQNSHVLKYQMDRPGELYAKIEKIRSVRWPSLLTIDAGHVNNSFTITAGHFDFKEQKTVVSTILECMPMEGRKINFNLMYQHVILPLAKDVNAIGLVADQWQGLDLLYRLAEDMGMNPLQKPRVKSVQYSPRRKDFNTLYAMLESKNILLPTVNAEFANRIFDGRVENWRVDMLHHAVEHLLLQMLTVKEEAETKPPVKGDGFTDDIFRSLVLLTKIHDPKVMERLKAASHWDYENLGGRNSMPKPAFAGRSTIYGFR